MAQGTANGTSAEGFFSRLFKRRRKHTPTARQRVKEFAESQTGWGPEEVTGVLEQATKDMVRSGCHQAQKLRTMAERAKERQKATQTTQRISTVPEI